MSAGAVPAAGPASEGVFAARAEGPWLFGRRTDLLAFGGSAALSFLLLAVGALTGALHADSPDWVWLACVVAIDVAHVWSTAFRVYLDGEEVRRRALLYWGVPIACYAAGVLLHAVSASSFWRVLAYAAVWHFVRQQYGWVALYRRRAGETRAIDRWIDTIAIYAATIWPIVWWHGHLPRRFEWMIEGDFVPGLAASVASALEPAYWAALCAFAGRQVWLVARGERVNAGKVLVVATTWAAWWIGIVALDSDYAFTVTNVLIHGIPYLVLTYRYGRARAEESPASAVARVLRGGVAAFVAFVVVLALAEEALWDRLVFHDRPWLFGDAPELGAVIVMLVTPLLAVPQATHYVLDAFVWKVRRGNPRLAREIGSGTG